MFYNVWNVLYNAKFYITQNFTFQGLRYKDLLLYLNKSLELVEESPNKKKRLERQSYPKKMLQNVYTCFQENFFSNVTDFQKESDDPSEMLKQLKEKFSQTEKRSEKIVILTLTC